MYPVKNVWHNSSLLAAAESQLDVLHPLVKAGGHLRLRLHIRDVLVGIPAATGHAAGAASIVFLWGSVVRRILECTFVC